MQLGATCGVPPCTAGAGSREVSRGLLLQLRRIIAHFFFNRVSSITNLGLTSAGLPCWLSLDPSTSSLGKRTAHRGAQVTGQEAARRWAALQLRPEAALLVGRFAVETSELLRVELLRCAVTLLSRRVVRKRLHLRLRNPQSCSTSLIRVQTTQHLCDLHG